VTANDETRTAPDYEPRRRHARPARVLVVDDHAGVRRGIIGLISANRDFEVVGEAADGAEAVRLVPEVAPDIVLMDVSMPVLDGVAATALIAHLSDPPAVLLFTAWAEQDRIAAAMSAGASGYVLKDARPAELFEAIHAALAAPRPAGRGDPDPVGRRDVQSPVRLPLGTRTAAHRRWPLRIVGGAAAVLAIGTAGVAAATEGRLPPAVQHAAAAVGLPTPADRLDQARQALTRLKVALRDGDPASIAAAAGHLRQRLADLNASDQAAVGAGGALWVADQQLKSPVAAVGSPAPPAPASTGGGTAPPGTTATLPPTSDDHSGGANGDRQGPGGATSGGGPGPSTSTATLPPTGVPPSGSPGGPPTTAPDVTSPGHGGGPPTTATQDTSPGGHGAGSPSTSSASPGGSHKGSPPNG
jgi:CheY-like chemotaxis protein